MCSRTLVLLSLVSLAWSLMSPETGCDTNPNYPNVNKLVSLKTNPWVAGNLSVVVYYVAFADTPSERRFRVTYAKSSTPNFFPKGLGETTIYGPELPDPRFNPINRVSKFFRQMTFGKITFSATYRRVPLSLDLSRDVTTAMQCHIRYLTEQVLDYVNNYEAPFYNYTKYDVTLIVFPEVDSGPTAAQFLDHGPYLRLGYNLMSLMGYKLLRHNDNNNEVADTYTLMQAFGKLFNFPDSDYSDLNSNSFPREDRTDMMGSKAVETHAFTNPINLLRMGVLDSSTDLRQITRTGVYRIWPLYPQWFLKDYSYANDLDLSTLDAITTVPEYQRYRGVILDPQYVVSGSSVTQGSYYSLIWYRSETTFARVTGNNVTRAMYKFSNSLVIHRYPQDQSNTAWTQIDPITVTSPTDDYMTNMTKIPVGHTFSQNLSPCSLNVLCRDTTTSPISFLVKAECTIANSDVISSFRTLDSKSIIPATISAKYNVRVRNSSILDSARRLGFVSVAIPGYNCKGAAALKYAFDPTASRLTSFSFEVTSNWLRAFKAGDTVALCYAEYSSGGVSDDFFVEQSVSPLIVQSISSVKYICNNGWDLSASGCTLNGVTTMYDDNSTYFKCNDGGLSDTFCCCVTASEQHSCSASSYSSSGRFACCRNRGFVQTWTDNNGYGNAKCACDNPSLFGGDLCDVLIGPVFTLTALYPTTKYVGSSFTLAAAPLGTPNASYTAACSAQLINGTTVFLQNINIPSTDTTLNTRSFSIFVADNNYVPYIIVSCAGISAGTSFSSNPPSTLNISISSKPQVTAPTFLRVLSYGTQGNLTIGWDAMTGFSSYPEFQYILSYRIYGSSGSFTSVATTNTSISLKLTVGTVYEFYVQSNTNTSTVSSDTRYFIPIDYNATCSMVNGDASPKVCNSNNCDSTFGTCSSGLDCWCKGWYHGDSCNISGCYASSSHQITGFACSGHGTCSSSGSSDPWARCVCNDGFYGIHCQRYDWLNQAIQFTSPQSMSVVQEKSTVTVSWTNPPDSASTGVSLYVQYGASGSTNDSFFYDAWVLLGDISYTNNVGSYQFTLPALVTKGFADGMVGFQVRDKLYTNLASTVYIYVTNPADPPTTAPTRTASPTTAPTSSGGDSGSSGIGVLWSGNNKLYTAIVGSVLVLGSSLGVGIICMGRVRRRMYGDELKDTRVTQMTGGTTTTTELE